MQIKILFACLKYSNFKSRHFFFKCLFFLLNVHHSSSKEKMILTLMINKTKDLKFVKFIFIAHLTTFGSNMFLAFKNYEF
jgi:hypothetical protein